MAVRGGLKRTVGEDVKWGIKMSGGWKYNGCKDKDKKRWWMYECGVRIDTISVVTMRVRINENIPAIESMDFNCIEAPATTGKIDYIVIGLRNAGNHCIKLWKREWLGKWHGGEDHESSQWNGFNGHDLKHRTRKHHCGNGERSRWLNCCDSMHRHFGKIPWRDWDSEMTTQDMELRKR